MATETKAIAINGATWTQLAAGPANVAVRRDAGLYAVDLHIGQSAPDGASPAFPMPDDGFAVSSDAFVDGDILWAKARGVSAGGTVAISVIRTIVA